MSKLAAFAFVLLASLAATAASADEQMGRAEAYLPENVADLVVGGEVVPAWSDNGARFTFEARSPDGPRVYEVDAATGDKRLRPADDAATRPAPSALLSASPTGSHAIALVDHDLIVVDAATSEQTPLTTNGTRDHAYASSPDTVARSLDASPEPPQVAWSPDGRRFATFRYDQRDVRELPHLPGTFEQDGHAVPETAVLKMPFPGDERVTTADLLVFDIESGSRIDVDLPPFLIADWNSPLTWLTWSGDGERFWVVREDRGYQTWRLHEVEAATGSARVVIEESADLPNRPHVGSVVEIGLYWPIADGEQFAWLSRRSGHGHLYLHDADGGLVRQLTSGDWNVQDVKHVGEERLYFTGNGREDGDPYYTHLYRVPLAGGEPERLTPEDADHRISFSPAGDRFVDTYSTVGEPPVTVLRSADGKLVSTVQETDISPLKALGWTPPRRFEVVAADGETPIFGTMYLPSDFDEGKSYPIVDAVYAGSHRASAPRRFGRDTNVFQATAELGFVVVVVDARGTSFRSQDFQNASYGRGFGDEAIVADHVAAIEQLAERHRFIDGNRVGIYGDSWGGYRAARAMFQFPDFFDVAVAGAGSHDNYLYNFEHERWFGLPANEPEAYAKQSNLPLADRLQGKLLLAHGDADGSVHVNNTLQLADALIRADRPFDLLILPGVGHDIGDSGYYLRRRWAYLVEHLLGDDEGR